MNDDQQHEAADREATIRARYTVVEPPPPCPVCGTARVVGEAGGGEPRLWICERVGRDVEHYLRSTWREPNIPDRNVLWLLDALAAEREARAAAERHVDVLKRRVWKLRPALALTLKRLNELYPQYEQHHEGGEISRVIGVGEQAIAETAGPTAAPPAGQPSAERREQALCEALLTGCPPSCEGPEHDGESDDHTGYVCMVCANFVDSIADPHHGAGCIVLASALAVAPAAHPSAPAHPRADHPYEPCCYPETHDHMICLDGAPDAWCSLPSDQHPPADELTVVQQHIRDNIGRHPLPGCRCDDCLPDADQDGETADGET